MLFLISDGDYLTEIDHPSIAYNNIVIEADNEHAPAVTAAVRYLASIKRKDLDEIVVNPLGEPVLHIA